MPAFMVIVSPMWSGITPHCWDTEVLALPRRSVSP